MEEGESRSLPDTMWAYGITTVPERQYNYFPTTLESLKMAGFKFPTIFVDGCSGDYSKYELPVVYRSSKIQAFGNWILTLLELWIRNPRAKRYAIFQDDFLAYRNLKDYLDTQKLPENHYWNLYTFPQNEELENSHGWRLSNQRGRGAVALVFGVEVVQKILASPKMIDKPRAVRNPHRSIDGTLIDSLAPLGVKELVHYPTLVQHIGDCSAIGNPQHKKPSSWMGEDFDAMELANLIKT